MIYLVFDFPMPPPFLIEISLRYTFYHERSQTCVGINNNITLLDVLASICKTRKNTFETVVYKKEINNDNFLNFVINILYLYIITVTSHFFTSYHSINGILRNSTWQINHTTWNNISQDITTAHFNPKFLLAYLMMISNTISLYSLHFNVHLM